MYYFPNRNATPPMYTFPNRHTTQAFQNLPNKAQAHDTVRKSTSVVVQKTSSNFLDFLDYIGSFSILGSGTLVGVPGFLYAISTNAPAYTWMGGGWRFLAKSVAGSLASWHKGGITLNMTWYGRLAEWIDSVKERNFGVGLSRKIWGNISRGYTFLAGFRGRQYSIGTVGEFHVQIGPVDPEAVKLVYEDPGYLAGARWRSRISTGTAWSVFSGAAWGISLYADKVEAERTGLSDFQGGWTRKAVVGSSEKILVPNNPYERRFEYTIGIRKARTFSGKLLERKDAIKLPDNTKIFLLNKGGFTAGIIKQGQIFEGGWWPDEA